VHLSIDEVWIKTPPSQFSTVDLARLRHDDAQKRRCGAEGFDP
jgi:hypothetical protein